MMHTILKYLPYVLLFAVATMIVYGWGLWRTMRHAKRHFRSAFFQAVLLS